MRHSFILAMTLLTTAAVAHAGESPFAGIDSVKDLALCTSGADGNYEGFIETTQQAFAQVAARTPPREMTERAFPAGQYEAFKANYQCLKFQYRSGDAWVEGFYLDRRDQGESPKPVIVFNRGGNGSFGALTLSQVMTRMGQLADAGYVVLASQYRQVDEFGGRDVEDVLALVTLAKSLPTADADRLGMFGWSRGGMMSFMAARGNPAVKAIVVGGAVTDLARELELRPEMERMYQVRIPNYASDKAAQLARRSVTTFIDEIPAATPILLIHGESDQRVSVDNTLTFSEALKAAGHPHDTLIFADGDHGLRRYNREVMARTIAWFDASLKQGRKSSI